MLTAPYFMSSVQNIHILQTSFVIIQNLKLLFITVGGVTKSYTKWHYYKYILRRQIKNKKTLPMLFRNDNIKLLQPNNDGSTQVSYHTFSTDSQQQLWGGPVFFLQIRNCFFKTKFQVTLLNIIVYLVIKLCLILVGYTSAI